RPNHITRPKVRRKVGKHRLANRLHALHPHTIYHNRSQSIPPPAARQNSMKVLGIRVPFSEPKES
ncbi:hypothetical protein A2U01_0103339, partial [Trifolium medium]|nr:hypothetical protein [Trifolium medium]